MTLRGAICEKRTMLMRGNYVKDYECMGPIMSPNKIFGPSCLSCLIKPTGPREVLAIQVAPALGRIASRCGMSLLDAQPRHF